MDTRTSEPRITIVGGGYVVVPLRRALALLFGREIVSLGHIEHPRLAGASAALAQTSIPRPSGAPDESVARVASEITTKNEAARLYVEGRRP